MSTFARVRFPMELKLIVQLLGFSCFCPLFTCQFTALSICAVQHLPHAVDLEGFFEFSVLGFDVKI